MPSALVQLQLQSQVAPQIAQTASAYKSLSAEEQKAERGATSYAQALQKVALADARTATEEQRLAVQTANVAKAQTQAELSALRLANAQNQAASGNSFAAQTADAFKGQILGMVGPVAIATAAIGALKGSIDLAQSSAKIDATRASFDNLARSVGATGDLLLGKLHVAAQGTASDANLIQAANSGLLLTQGRIAGDLPRILSIARAAAQATGDDVGFVFDSLVTGIARGSPKVIDNAKITLDASAAFETYAASIGKSADALTAAEQQQATLNAVLKAGDELIKNAGPATDGNAAAWARASVTVENFKNGLGTLLANGFRPYVESVGAMGERTSQFITWIQEFGTTVPGSEAALAAFDAEMAKSGDATKAEAAYQAALAQARQQAADATARATAVQIAYVASLDEDRVALGKAQTLAQQSIQVQLAYADSLELTGVRARAAAQAADQKSAADKVAAIDAQTHAIAQNQLAQQAESAAQALLKAGPAGARTAAILAGSSSQVDVATAAYYRLFAAQQSTGGGAAAASSQLPRDLQISAGIATNLANQTTISRDRILQTGTAVQKLALAQEDAAKAARDFGANSLEAGLAQNKAIAAQQAVDAEKKSGAGRVSSAESTALKLNDIARTSGDDRARIERESLEKLRDAQQDFDVRSSRAQEDYEEKRRKLLAGGQRAQAAALAADFAKDRRRAQEDFDRDRGRTLRNNREALGDQGTRVGNQVESIAARTAARGGGPVGLPSAVSGGGALPSLPSAPAGRGGGTIAIQSVVNMDGKATATGLWQYIRVMVDEDLALTLQSIGAPGSGQPAVAGVG